ncbi:MAG: hypothetical protein N3E49_08805 [Bacteroidia bacterium]|nr:hypothetical protein [Bacteroidia bacterium]
MPPSCSNCTPLIVQNGNATVPNGETRCVPSDMSLTITNLNIGNNANLLICGQLHLNGWVNLNNHTQVWVTPSGTLNAQGANINSHTIFYNYGMVNLSNSLNLNGNNSRFYNIGSGAQLNVGGAIHVNSSNGLLNYGGMVTTPNLTLNGNGSVCAANGACFSTANFTSNGNNTINVVGNNPVALHFTHTSTINGGSVTSSTNLYVCQGPGAQQNGSGSWGAAQVVSNCASGCGVLSYKILTVRTSMAGTSVHVEWGMEGHTLNPIASYAVSVFDGADWTEIGRTATSSFWIPIESLPRSIEWIIQVEGYGSDGTLLAVGQARVARETKRRFLVYPTTFSRELRYESEGTHELYLISITGQRVARLRAQAGSGLWRLDEEGFDLAELPAGIYILSGEGIPPIRLWKQP